MPHDKLLQGAWQGAKELGAAGVSKWREKKLAFKASKRLPKGVTHGQVVREFGRGVKDLGVGAIKAVGEIRQAQKSKLELKRMMKRSRSYLGT